MAVFTTTDRDNVKAALVTAAVEGVASVSVGGQAVTTYTLDQLRALLKEIVADLASDVDSMGLTFRKLVPPGCG